MIIPLSLQTVGLLPHGGMMYLSLQVTSLATSPISNNVIYFYYLLSHHCLSYDICGYPATVAMYIERSEQGAKGPHGSFAHLHVVLGMLQCIQFFCPLTCCASPTQTPPLYYLSMTDNRPHQITGHLKHAHNASNLHYNCSPNPSHPHQHTANMAAPTSQSGATRRLL